MTPSEIKNWRTIGLASWMPLLLLATLPLSGQVSSVVSRPSFDCSKAKTQVEKWICADARLGDLDLEIAALYKELLAIHPVKGFIKARQVDTIKTRNYCQTTNGLLKDMTKNRDQLRASKTARVFSDTDTFALGGGDFVAELFTNGSGTFLQVFGGAAWLRTANNYVTCDNCYKLIPRPGVPGSYTAEQTTLVVSIDSGAMKLAATNPDDLSCGGFSRMKEELAERRDPSANRGNVAVKKDLYAAMEAKRGPTEEDKFIQSALKEAIRTKDMTQLKSLSTASWTLAIIRKAQGNTSSNPILFALTIHMYGYTVVEVYGHPDPGIRSYFSQEEIARILYGLRDIISPEETQRLLSLTAERVIPVVRSGLPRR